MSILGEVALCDLSAPRVLRDWIAKLCETKTHRPGETNAEGRTLSAGTIRKVVVTLCQIAKAHDVPLVVQLAEPLRQKRRKSRPKALQSIEEVRALLAAIRPRDAWFRVACALACFAGLRRGEVASLRRAGLPPLTFHELRATYATLVADQGLPVSKLSALLGHADAATTAIYVRSEARHAAKDPRAVLGDKQSDQLQN